MNLCLSSVLLMTCFVCYRSAFGESRIIFLDRRSEAAHTIKVIFCSGQRQMAVWIAVPRRGAINAPPTAAPLMEGYDKHTKTFTFYSVIRKLE